MTSQPENSNTSAPLEGFARLEPAMTISCELVGQFPCGDIHTGSTLACVPFSGGYIRSVEGFEPKVDFTIKAGHDWFRVDADKKFGRLSISAVAADAEGQALRVIADGITDLNEHTLPLLLGDPNAKTNPFGFGVNHMRFETGHEPYKPLEGMMFASSQRFVKDEKTGAMIAELRLSRIIPGSGYQ
ncbi:hypothetical protein N7447_009516 [Penicillium robsamsonii]|uniref:uncharacterized protein n=1 Tax=Penicillium robsamsonii TaxID=1792511 RepID=UPI0025490F48|nr:uncharacterized protein N7447_009516 [Penicillium robsamsonii]KAJ5817283.1 hypothetical protein N7447_009516 [Penicillium robsamsonii]